MSRYRLLFVAGAGVAAVLVGLLLFGNLNRNLVYFLTPTEAVTQRVEWPDGQRLQIGGLVEPGSVTRTADGVRFTLAAQSRPGGPTIAVHHTGAPAQLFRSGIGVVVEGAWGGDVFRSDTMMVKHDENYRAPEEPSS